MTKVSGLFTFNKICPLAQQANVLAAPNSFYCTPGLPATLHLIASTPGWLGVEFRTDDPEAPLLRNPIQVVEGFGEILTGPGLGVELNEEAWNKFAYGQRGRRCSPLLGPVLFS